MPQLFRAELLLPKEMAPPEWRRYEDELYKLLSQIFACSDEGQARRGLIGDDATHAWIQLYLQGLGLITVIPVTLGGVLRSTARNIKARARKRARSMRN